MTATVEELQAEVTRLKAHADDLLNERKAEKQRREAAENALATLQEAHDGLASKLDAVTLDGPVLRALENVVVAPPAQGRKLLENAGIQFVMGKEGVPVALDGEQEVPLPDLHAHLSKRCHTPEGEAAFAWIIRGSLASGGGAVGGSMHAPTRPAKEQQVIKPAQNLGLR